MNYDVIVIGGGAAGLMSAIEAGKRGRRVLLLEGSNHIGKKILMSGGGRCNFTNLDVTPDNFLSANPHFCKSALARYNQWDFIALVEKHGIAWHEKELGQLFCDNSSKQIVAMLRAECDAADVSIVTRAGIDAIDRAEEAFLLHTARGNIRADSLVVATGGLSIPKMGASGFGYTIARQFGHDILPTRAGLVPLTFNGAELERYTGLAGIGIPAATQAGGHRFDSGLLFTHRGISGPTILQASSYWQPGEPVDVDLLPQQDIQAWLQARKVARPDAMLQTVLAELLPKRLTATLCSTGLENHPMRRIDNDSLVRLARKLAAWSFRPSGSEGYRTAEVTLGGVNVDEISSSSFESRRQPGLYFIGEVLDVTGHLGGYNFQWAWASGHAAGNYV